MVPQRPAHATEATPAIPAVWLQVSPTGRSISLKPGDTYDGEFTVSNIGSEPFDFHVYASPFSVVGESYEHDYLSEKNYNQIARWVTFDTTDYSLAVGASQTIPYHISVPADVLGGSQHAILFAESKASDASSSDPSATGGGVKAISRVGTRLSASIAGETSQGVQITEYSFPSLYVAFDGPNISATSKIKNTGTTDLDAQYQYEIKPFFGDTPLFGDVETVLIYPDSEFRHAFNWTETPLLGLFSVTYSVTARDISMSESRVILVIPAWLVIIFILLLTSLVILIILKVKKRRHPSRVRLN
jgi:hypothetical protein